MSMELSSSMLMSCLVPCPFRVVIRKRGLASPFSWLPHHGGRHKEVPLWWPPRDGLVSRFPAPTPGWQSTISYRFASIIYRSHLYCRGYNSCSQTNYRVDEPDFSSIVVKGKYLSSFENARTRIKKKTLSKLECSVFFYKFGVCAL